MYVIDLARVLRDALIGLAFQAPDMGEDIVHDQVRSHLRHHPEPLLAWNDFRLAYDKHYDSEKTETNEKTRDELAQKRDEILDQIIKDDFRAGKLMTLEAIRGYLR